MVRVPRPRIAAAAAVALFALVAGCHGNPDEMDPAPRPDSPNTRTAAERDPDEDATLSIEDLIRRRAPGVTVIRNGRSFQVRVRGVSSTGGVSGTDALVVIDGVAQDSPDALADVNPLDVVKIEVLKDAAASLYGSRGQNGVLVITTRRARR